MKNVSELKLIDFGACKSGQCVLKTNLIYNNGCICSAYKFEREEEFKPNFVHVTYGLGTNPIIAGGKCCFFLKKKSEIDRVK